MVGSGLTSIPGKFNIAHSIILATQSVSASVKAIGLTRPRSVVPTHKQDNAPAGINPARLLLSLGWIGTQIALSGFKSPMIGTVSNSSDSSRPVSGQDVAAPQVSVLMLTCDRPQFLGRAIQSVINQSLEDWELIVVHDGPNPQTAAIIDQWVKRDPRIRYFHRDRGGNIANACNYGLARARGQYVAILDDDDYWVPADKLRKQVAFLKSHPDYAGCGGGMTVIDDKENVQMSYLKPEQDDEIRARALYANPMTHSTTMFRRSLGEGIGYYDESLAGYQDWDIWLRFGRLGKLYNFPEVFARYTLWSGGGSFQQQRKNVLSAVKIVFRHRTGYRGFTGALALVLMHVAYAHLPARVRKSSFSFLARRKKAMFAGKQKGTGSAQ